MADNNDATPPSQQHLSAYQIAEILKRSYRSIVCKIDQLKIKPTLTLNGRKYYSPDTTSKVESSLRAPNKSKQETNTSN